MKSPSIVSPSKRSHRRVISNNSLKSPTPKHNDNNNPGLLFKSLLPSLEIPRQDASSAVVNMSKKKSTISSQQPQPKAIVLVGGRGGGRDTSEKEGGNDSSSQALRIVELLEWNLKRYWWRLPDLRQGRCGCAVATLGQTMYVMGGLNAQSQPLQTVEEYTIGASDKFQYCSPMATARWYCAATAVPELHQILVVGGRNESWQELDSCELYSIHSGRWEASMSKMNNPRFGCGICLLEQYGTVMVFGGYDGSQWLKTCETYRAETDIWETKCTLSSPQNYDGASSDDQNNLMIEPMPIRIEFCIASAWGDYVFVRGTVSVYDDDDDYDADDKQRKAITQIYSIKQNKWAVAPSSNMGEDDDGEQEPINASMVALAQRCVVMGGTVVTKAQPDEDQRRRQDAPDETSSSEDEESDDEGDDHEVNVTTTCTSIKVDLERLLASSASDLPTAPFLDEEDSRHPLYERIIPSNLSIKSASSISRAGGGPGAHPRQLQKVQNENLLDNYGAQVLYTGNVLVTDNSYTSMKMPSGEGKMRWIKTGDIYEGSFEYGARQGRGRLTYKNGDVFEGFYQDDQRQGRGRYTYRDGRIYEGMYVDDFPEDPNGKMVWPKDGATYQGQFRRGKRTGKGTMAFPKSNVKYQGDFVTGKYHGYGCCQFTDGSIYAGQWENGKAHGIGKLKSADGRIIHRGKWENDGPVVE